MEEFWWDRVILCRKICRYNPELIYSEDESVFLYYVLRFTLLFLRMIWDQKIYQNLRLKKLEIRSRLLGLGKMAILHTTTGANPMRG